MRSAAGATDFFPDHSAGSVFEIFHVIWRDRLKIAWPAGAGIKHIFVAEKNQIASGAMIDSVLVFSPGTGERSFRPVLTHNPELLRSENFLPLLFGFVYFFNHKGIFFKNGPCAARP